MKDRSIEEQPEQRPAFSPTLEKGLLNVLFTRGQKAMHEALSLGLIGEHFYVPAHQLIWENLRRRCEGSASLSLPLIAAELEENRQLENVGGLPGLTDILIPNTVGTGAVSVSEAVAKLKSMHSRRLVLNQAHELISTAGTLERPMEMLREICARFLDEYTDTKDSYYADWSAMTQTTINELDNQIRRGTHIEGLCIGFPTLDNWTCGLRGHSGYYLAVARPGVGKTAFAINAMSNVMRNLQQEESDRRIIYVTAEMSPQALNRRILMHMLGTDWNALCRQGRNPNELENIGRHLNRMKRFPIDMLVPRGSVAEVTAAIRRRCHGGDVALVVVDYIQLFHAQGADGSRVDEMERVSDDFRRLALDIPTPVLALAQTNRGVDHTRDKEPQLADIKGCGAFEQDAELVFFLSRPEIYATSDEEREQLRGKASLIVRKNRKGPLGVIPLIWESETQKFTECGAAAS